MSIASASTLTVLLTTCAILWCSPPRQPSFALGASAGSLHFRTGWPRQPKLQRRLVAGAGLFFERSSIARHPRSRVKIPPPEDLSRQRRWWQGRDLNPRPKAYESSALPLSYPAVQWEGGGKIPARGLSSTGPGVFPSPLPNQIRLQLSAGAPKSPAWTPHRHRRYVVWST